MSTNLRTIAAQLRAAADQYPREPSRASYQPGYRHLAVKDEAPPRACFQFGTLRLSCKGYQEAVLAMAAKFDRIPKLQGQGLPRMPTLHRPKDSDAVLAALDAECGDQDAYLMEFLNEERRMAAA